MIWHTREQSGLRLDRQLAWWHDDVRLEHPNIVEAFNRGVRVLDDGRYQLHFGGDFCFIAVDDCGFAVVAVDEGEDTSDRLSLRLSDRTAEWLDPTSLALDETGALTARVKDGRGKARFSREAHFELGARLELDGAQVVLVVRGRRWPTGLPPSALMTPDAGTF